MVIQKEQTIDHRSKIEYFSAPFQDFHRALCARWSCWSFLFQPDSKSLLDIILLFCPLHSSQLSCSVQRPQLAPATPCIPNNPLNLKPLLVCQSVPCKCELCKVAACVCVCNLPAECSSLCVCVCVFFCDAVAEVLLQLLLLYLCLSSLPPARTATLLTMSRPSADSIWTDLRKRTGTITLFSFFRWVPSERRKEGRGEEVNKPSAFLQKNKETLDRHLYFSMK